jgi:hypothetical protein
MCKHKNAKNNQEYSDQFHQQIPPLIQIPCLLPNQREITVDNNMTVFPNKVYFSSNKKEQPLSRMAVCH